MALLPEVDKPLAEIIPIPADKVNQVMFSPEVYELLTKVTIAADMLNQEMYRINDTIKEIQTKLTEAGVTIATSIEVDEMLLGFGQVTSEHNKWCFYVKEQVKIT